MSKTATIDALMQSAAHVFSRDGYDGAALRDIARSADVPLSTIHLYFGSKAELFTAVRMAAWVEIDRERTLYLEQALARHQDRSPPLEDLLYALAYPIVRRALGTDALDVARVSMLRNYWHGDLHSTMLDVADRSMVRWIDAITRIFPSLSRTDAVWAFSFAVGAIYSWQIIDHRYDTLLGAGARPAVDEVTADIVAFCSQGVQAIAARRDGGLRGRGGRLEDAREGAFQGEQQDQIVEAAPGCYGASASRSRSQAGARLAGPPNVLETA